MEEAARQLTPDGIEDMRDHGAGEVCEAQASVRCFITAPVAITLNLATTR